MRDAEMQIECAIHSGGVSRGAASVEEVLGVDTNSCMNMNMKSMLAILVSATMAQSIVEIAGNSVETSRGGV
jgi:hypothetical protein